ncbi:AbrB family transcriptional regulator [Halobacillus salinarum]|uniref:AbrB family transcriptional regulator n=1 Tax=Halobacillus salinarum TaxID=2932257 RepID=A0ABY4EE96_9BACI|nr:AbrB family transcriptional regulator [Halobacillus salinarum]UOQ42786.1 AbrB family transcriptional regulator [Halobacillus salinarum]
MKLMIGRSIGTYTLAITGGVLFWALRLPLAWILGPVALLMVYKLLVKKETYSSSFIRNTGFNLMGIQIGLTFSSHTFSSVLPYLLPYTFLSLMIIAISLCLAVVISKRTSVDLTTSMIGSAPGGLSAMIAVSDSLRGNTILVTIFQTIRLISVLFIVPFIAVHFLYQDHASSAGGALAADRDGPFWTVLFYFVAFITGYLLKNKIPASFIIIPMLSFGLLQSLGFSVYELPNIWFIAAQLVIGAHLGHTIELRDVIKAGRYCAYYFVLALLLITCSLVLGCLLSLWTDMNLTTAILSLAPGGLIEMAVTAGGAGGDPAIVSSLQIIRLLTIVLLLPFLFKKFIPKLI